MYLKFPLLFPGIDLGRDSDVGSEVRFHADALPRQPPLNYVLLLIGMMVARAEQATVLLCGRGAMKIPVLETDEGVLKTAIKLQAQVQVRNVPVTQAREHFT